MLKNFLLEVEEERDLVVKNAKVAFMRRDILDGAPYPYLLEVYDDWITSDCLIVMMALELGWDDSEYRNDNTYDDEGEDEDAMEDYNDERDEIVDSAWDFIHEKHQIETKIFDEFLNAHYDWNENNL